jgi:hypothetical protein
VSIRHEGETDVISLTQGDPVAAGVVVLDALGICEADFASWYLSQIIKVSDWRYHSGRRHYDEQTQTWQLWDGSRYVTRHFLRNSQ